eukprot:COSAG02_NODE_47061_length_344_cov_0.546939_1_plen_31_part_10
MDPGSRSSSAEVLSRVGRELQVSLALALARS